MEGWIKLHRKFLNWEWFSDQSTSRLFLCLLLLANHDDGCWLGQKVRCGQVITGRKSLKKLTSLSEQQIRTSLKKLQSTNEITIKSTNKFSIITIIKWREYQVSEKKQPAKQPANQQTSNQPLTTNKNDKNEKNISKDISDKSDKPFSSKEYIKILIGNKQRHIHIIGLFFSYKEIEFENLAQVQAQMKRLFRPAKSLEGYSDDRILATMDALDKESQQDKKYVWGLETILKRIDIIN